MCNIYAAISYSRMPVIVLASVTAYCSNGTAPGSDQAGGNGRVDEGRAGGEWRGAQQEDETRQTQQMTWQRTRQRT